MRLATGLRYRMLETVREFGRMQLVDAGEDDEARDALRRWATAYARLHGARLPTAEQLLAIDALSAEEVNLADELRGAISGGDVAALVQLLAALGIFWAMRGEHGRLIVLSEARCRRGARLAPAAGASRMWRAAAMTILMSNSMIAGEERISPIRAMLQRLGPESGGDPRLAGSIKVMMAYDPADPGTFLPRIEQLAADPDREHGARPRRSG